MTTDHRKPAVAFVVLAFAAAALVGVQQADAQAGRFLAAVVGSDAHGRGEIAATSRARSPQETSLGPAFTALAWAAEPPGGSSRTEEDEQVSRTQQRPPVPEPVARVKQAKASEPASPEPDVRGQISQDVESARRSRGRDHEPGERGADRRQRRAAEQAAVPEERGSRHDRHGDGDD
jgi:hypothetical protein